MPEGNIKADKKNGNDAVIQIKNNQKTSLKKIQEFIENSQALSVFEKQEKKKRNRIEYRKIEVFLPESSLLNENTLFEYARCFVKVYRRTEVFNTKKKDWITREESSYFISTAAYEAVIMAKIIRYHWSIENSNNYIKDTVLKEDFSRIRVNPGIISRLKSFALNILRVNKVNNIKRTVFKNSLDFNRILKLRWIY